MNTAFKGTVNPSTYKHVLSCRLPRLAKCAGEFSPMPGTKHSVTDGGSDRGNSGGKPTTRTTTYLHLPERSEGLEIQRAALSHPRPAPEAQSSPRPLRTGHFEAELCLEWWLFIFPLLGSFLL